MIELTQMDGGTLSVNPLHIFTVRPTEGGSLVMAPGGAAVAVQETVAQIGRKVARWTKGE